MDRLAKPRRPSDSAQQPSRRRASTPAASESPATNPQALPSIRHLHPHLTLPTTTYYAPSDTSGYQSQTPLTSFEQPPVASSSGSFNAPLTSQPPSELLPIAEASDSEKEESAPPKKRRKRQALSCTECKRRKIKCDRNQPCGPCTHRNEPQKCQWHQVETNDKYVTRTEYEQLKAKVDRLEAVIERLTNSGNMPSQGIGTSASPYTHPSRPPSVPTAAYHLGPDTRPDLYLNQRRLASMPSIPHTVMGAVSPPVDRDTFRTLSRMHPPATTPHATRQLPPSLAAITTPYELEGPKNRRAQTLTWQGGRLRQAGKETCVLALLQSNHNNHPPPSILLQSLRLYRFTLVPLLFAIIAHLAIIFHLLLFPNGLEIPRAKILPRLFENAIMD